MSDFMDLVICKHDNNSKVFIFRAPAWTGLKKGEAEATVEKTYTVDVSDKDSFEFILMAGGVSLPLKRVLKRVMFIDLDYGDEGGEHE